MVRTDVAAMAAAVRMARRRSTKTPETDDITTPTEAVPGERRIQVGIPAKTHRRILDIPIGRPPRADLLHRNSTTASTGSINEAPDPDPAAHRVQIIVDSTAIVTEVPAAAAERRIISNP